MRKLHFRKK